MLRKVFVFGICAVLAISMLTGCKKEYNVLTTTEDIHQNHGVSAQWERDGKQHWRLCDCGEKASAGEHALDESSICKVCGADVWLFEDGSAYVNDYDEKGNVLRYSAYDAEGMLENEQIYTYEYDSDGNMTLSKQYADSVLVEEITYTVNKVGEVVPVKQTGYDIDGTWAVNEYDEQGNVTKIFTYSSEGAVTFACDIVYAENVNGDLYEAVRTAVAEDGSKTISEYNEYGDIASWKVYDAEGNLTDHLRTEYVYVEGVYVSSKFYVADVLDSECEYAQDENGFSYIVKEMVYAEDGAYTVYEYNAEGELLKETAYDKDGKEIPAADNKPETTKG